MEGVAGGGESKLITYVIVLDVLRCYQQAKVVKELLWLWITGQPLPIMLL